MSKWRYNVKISDCLDIMYGKDQKMVEDNDNGTFPILGTGGIMGYSTSYLCDKPSVLIGRKGTIDEPQYMDTPFWTIDTLYYTDVYPENSAKYLFYVFQTIPWKKYNEATGVPSLAGSTIGKIKISLPASKNEQSKIADVLTTVDEAIDKTRALIEKYKNIKAGMMQDLLGNSDEVLLGDNRYFDINPRTSSLPRRFYYIDLESVISGELLKQDIFERINAPSRAQRLLKPYDILFQTVRPYQQNNYFFEQEFDLPSVASTGYAQIRTSQNPKFIYYALHTGSVLRSVIAKCTGSSYPAINSTELKKVSITMPSIEEQNRVAKQISAVDQKIQTERNYLAKLQDIKQGLMQDLLTNTVSVDALL